MQSSKMDKNKSFQALFSKFKEAFPDKKSCNLQVETITFWNSIKTEVDFENRLNAKLLELSKVSRRKKSNLMMYWNRASEKKDADVIPSTSKAITIVSNSSNQSDGTAEENPNKDLSHDKAHQGKTQHQYDTPAQTALKNQIDIPRQEILASNARQQADLLSISEHKALKSKKMELQEAEKKLKNKRKSQERSAKYRENRKRKLGEICTKDPEIAKKLRMKEKPGRPRVGTSEDQPELLKTIIDIATHGSAADEKRRAETIRSIKILDELTQTLKTDFGFNISRSGVYLRLIPRRTDSTEGKRHTTTVPVKLIRAQNEAHKKHIDAKFATATIHNLEEIASLLGPKEVIFISQGDKARVPIGITAANKQTPLLMHMEYRVTLPDHDWVVAPSHKLISSVYAGITIKEGGFGNRGVVTYSGPTFITIRSAKHSSSTAYSHALDIDRVFKLPEFEAIARNDEQVKPVGIFTVDGGPDENPRYSKVIVSAIHHFVTYDLDALYIACNARGRSAYNRVERRMAPLSKELASIILPHDHYGTHLDNQGRTIDAQKEKENFAHAGESLAQIWSNMVIDQFPVVSQYIKPEESEMGESILTKKSIGWHSKHVRSSQYFLQIVKCRDETCCPPFRSSLLKVLPDRFLPPPVPSQQSDKGLVVAEGNGTFPSLFIAITLQHTTYPQAFREWKEIPYDITCPSIKRELLSRKTCKKCGIYHASLTYLKQHQSWCGVASTVPKIRPVRIATKRQRELLAIIQNLEDQEDALFIRILCQSSKYVPDESKYCVPVY